MRMLNVKPRVGLSSTKDFLKTVFFVVVVF